MFNKRLLMSLILITVSMVCIVLWNIPKSKHVSLPTVNAFIDTKPYVLYAPNSVDEQRRGLAIFDQISDNEGMIFRGNPVGQQGIWMKDMKFDIDVLWIDKDNTIIYLEKNISKASYPKIYQNPENTSSAYIIELASGQIEKNGFSLGEIVHINL